MSKPCYTCADNFVKSKLQTLLEKKIQDAERFAAETNYKGMLAIVALSSGNGFAIRTEDQGTQGYDVKKYLYYD